MVEPVADFEEDAIHDDNKREQTVMLTCPRCNAARELGDQPCWKCDGTGEVEAAVSIDILANV